MCALLRDSKYASLRLKCGSLTRDFLPSWNSETFISSYVNIPIFIILYLGFKFIKKTKIVPLAEIPIHHFVEQLLEYTCK